MGKGISGSKMGNINFVTRWEKVFSEQKMEKGISGTKWKKYFRDKNGKSISGTEMEKGISGQNGKAFPGQNGKGQLVSVKDNK